MFPRIRTSFYFGCALLVVLFLNLSDSFGQVDQNHYEVLGVPPTASTQEITRAYRRLAMQLHPDRTGGDPEKEEKFKNVQIAYDILSDEQKRRAFDRRLRNGFAASQPSQYQYAQAYNAPAAMTLEDRLVAELESAGAVPIEELILVGMRFLNTEAPVGAKTSSQDLHKIAESMYRVWTRAGARTSRLIVMEASFKVAFLYLQRLRALAPDLYEHYFSLGYEHLLKNLDLTQGILSAGSAEYLSRIHNVLRFASGLSQSWTAQSACREYLKTGTDSSTESNVDYSI